MNREKLVVYQQQILFRIKSMLREARVLDISVAERLCRWKDNLESNMPVPGYNRRFL